MQEQSFSYDVMQTYGRVWIRFEKKKNEKKFTYTVLVVALKAKHKSRIFTIFPEFFQVWKIAGQDSVRTLRLVGSPPSRANFKHFGLLGQGETIWKAIFYLHGKYRQRICAVRFSTLTPTVAKTKTILNKEQEAIDRSKLKSPVCN